MSFIEPNSKKLGTLEEYKSTKLRINLDQVNVVEKIELHKKTCEIVFKDLLQNTTNLGKLQSMLKKV